MSGTFNKATTCKPLISLMLGGTKLRDKTPLCPAVCPALSRFVPLRDKIGLVPENKAKKAGQIWDKMRDALPLVPLPPALRAGGGGQYWDKNGTKERTR